MIARTTSIFAALLAVCCMALALPGGALAAEVRGGQTVVVSSGETVDDDLFFGGGQTATISGHVTGDAYAVAQTVVVTGTVDGDLIAAGREVIVDGTISGNVRAAGATITVNGTVGRSLTGAAQQVNISPNGHVGGSVVAAAETISQFGPIGRGMTVGGGAVQLAGPVGGPVLARVETLSVAPTARLASGLDYQAKQEATLPPGTVNGSLQFSPPPQRPEQPAPPLNGLFDLGGLVALVGSFLVGALALVLAPRASARAIELGRQQPWPSFGLGTLALIGVPIGCMLLALTLVGLPTSVGLFALYIVSLLLAWPAVGLLLGTWLVRLVRPSRQLAPLGTLALGLIALHLATHLLFIGGVIGVCALILGLGLVLRGVRGSQSPTSLAHAVAAVPVAA